MLPVLCAKELYDPVQPVDAHPVPSVCSDPSEADSSATVDCSVSSEVGEAVLMPTRPFVVSTLRTLLVPSALLIWTAVVESALLPPEGEYISGIAMQSGTVYTWGKGEHEKPKFNDYLEYSSPFVILEQK